MRHWFEDLADYMGPAYLRYAFTKGTEQEVGVLADLLDLALGDRILDVGCGPGRHSLELARRGFQAVGLDVSETFIGLARESAEREGLASADFLRGDARDLSGIRGHGEFDAAICLCQGAFGLMDDAEGDAEVLASIAAAVRPGGGVVLTAFNAYFSVRHHVEASFDAATGTSRERTTIHDPLGRPREVEFVTRCYTPPELRSLVAEAGLVLTAMYGVEPGAYGRSQPTVDLPEFLVVARRPS